MAYLFVVGVGLLGIVIYLTVMFSAIPGAVDERLGALETLPEHLGQWLEDTDTEEGKRAAAQGLIREIRHLHEPKSGLFGREHIVLQVRYRDRQTRKIVRVDPEVKLVRRRVKA